MLVFALSIGMLSSSCPMKIGIARDGAVFATRMQGWYRTNENTLARVLRAGCYNDANPSAVTSVNLKIAQNAPKKRVEHVFSILEKAGWPEDKISAGTWTNDPREPR